MQLALLLPMFVAACQGDSIIDRLAGTQSDGARDMRVIVTRLEGARLKVLLQARGLLVDVPSSIDVSQGGALLDDWLDAYDFLDEGKQNYRSTFDVAVSAHGLQGWLQVLNKNIFVNASDITQTEKEAWEKEERSDVQQARARHTPLYDFGPHNRLEVKGSLGAEELIDVVSRNHNYDLVYARASQKWGWISARARSADLDVPVMFERITVDQGYQLILDRKDSPDDIVEIDEEDIGLIRLSALTLEIKFDVSDPNDRAAWINLTRKVLLDLRAQLQECNKSGSMCENPRSDLHEMGPWKIEVPLMQLLAGLSSIATVVFDVHDDVESLCAFAEEINALLTGLQVPYSFPGGLQTDVAYDVGPWLIEGTHGTHISEIDATTLFHYVLRPLMYIRNDAESACDALP